MLKEVTWRILSNNNFAIIADIYHHFIGFIFKKLKISNINQNFTIMTFYTKQIGFFC